MQAAGETPRDAVLFTMLPEEFAESTLADFPLETSDSADSRVL